MPSLRTGASSARPADRQSRGGRRSRLGVGSDAADAARPPQATLSPSFTAAGFEQLEPVATLSGSWTHRQWVSAGRVLARYGLAEGLTGILLLAATRVSERRAN